jgi:hypothetical protein
MRTPAAKDEAATHDDLRAGEGKACFEVAMTDEGDDHKLGPG